MLSTPHISLLNDIGFAKTVLMPGDPLRAKFIAEHFLENAVLVNNVRGTLAPTCSYALLKAADACAEKLGLRLKVGNFLSSDTFYDADAESTAQWANNGSIAVEMEAAGLYLNAMRCKKHALAICTVSDLPFTGESCTAEERQNTFTDMMRLALETAISLED